MKITVDIPNKTIQIHGSFKYEEYQSMHKDLPLEWKGFTFEIVPVYVETRPWICNPLIQPDTTGSPFGYPTATYSNGAATYNDTLDSLNCTSCKCNDVAEKVETPPNQPSLFD